MLSSKSHPGTFVFTPYSRIVHERVVQRMFGSQWKQKLAVGRVQSSTSKRQRAGKRAERYVTCEWFVLPAVLLKEVSARGCFLRETLDERKLEDVVVHTTYAEQLSGLGIRATALSHTESARSGVDCANGDDCASDTGAAASAANDAVAHEENAGIAALASVASGASEGEEVDSSGWEWGEQAVDIREGTRWQSWSVRGFDGAQIKPGDGKPRYAVEYFESVFPMPHLNKVVRYTNEVLANKGKRLTSRNEIMKWIGVLLACTRFEFASRSELWRNLDVDDLVRSPELGRFMARERFDLLMLCVRFSCSVAEEHEPEEGTDPRRLLVSEFLDAINEHKKTTIVAGSTVCIDEGYSRWYGPGGSWASVFLAIDREPEKGCEFWMTADGESGISLRVEYGPYVKKCTDRACESEHSHGTAMTMRMVEQHAGSGRHVIGNSYVSSVQCANLLYTKLGLYFTGLVEDATASFPMRALASAVLPPEPGSWRSMRKVVDDVPMIASVWADRTRKYFISTCGSTVAAPPMQRSRWKETGYDADKVDYEIPIHKLGATYFRYCDVVDHHNRSRQDTLNLEKFEFKTWDMRVVTMLVGILVVDAYKLYQGAITRSVENTIRLDIGGNPLQTQREYVRSLIMNLLRYDSVRRERLHAATSHPATQFAVLPVVPTKRKLTNGKTVQSKRRKQLRCKMCGKKASAQCVGCGQCYCSPFTAAACIEAHQVECGATVQE